MPGFGLIYVQYVINGMLSGSLFTDGTFYWLFGLGVMHWLHGCNAVRRLPA